MKPQYLQQEEEESYRTLEIDDAVDRIIAGMEGRLLLMEEAKD